MPFGTNVASLMAKRMKDLLASRKQRDVSVNNTRQGFTPMDREIDKEAYSKRSGRRRCG